jgi:hypothetical protein
VCDLLGIEDPDILIAQLVALRQNQHLIPTTDER